MEYGYWLNYYRWESLSRTVDPETGQVVLHPDALPFVHKIADELAVVRQICPTFGPPYSLEGQLRLFVLHESHGADLIRKGACLAPYDPPTCLVAGELAAREGKLDQAEPLLTRAVELEPSYFREVAELYLKELKRPDLARALANGDHNRLDELANMMEGVPGYSEKVNELRAEAEAGLRSRVAEHAATSQELASLARIDLVRSKFESAIELYRQALSQDYQHVDWRLSLAEALAKTDQVEPAIHEVRIVLRLRPHDAGATKLLEELTVRAENARTKTKPL